MKTIFTKRRMGIVLLLAFLIGMASLAAASTASANAGTKGLGITKLRAAIVAAANEGTSGSEITNVATSVTADKAKTKSVSVVGGKISNKTVLYIKAKGLPASQQNNCFYTKAPMKRLTNYRSAVTGKIVWHNKSYPAGYKFCKVGGKVIDPICGNTVLINPPAKPPKPILKGKLDIRPSLTWKAVAQARVVATSKATARAWCTTSAGGAEASAMGFGSSKAFARATVRGKTKSAVIAAAQGKANNIALNMTRDETYKLRAQALAFADATSNAYASARCTLPPTPPDACPDIPGNQPPGYPCDNNPPPPLDCEDIYGPGYVGIYPNCHKDGTVTPDPDPETPGPNPDPEDPTVPGSQCYDPVTGLPVPPGTPGAYCGRPASTHI